MRTSITCLAVIAATVMAAPSQAQKPDTGALVAKASAYLGDLFTKLSNIVAEERYVQQTTSPRRTRTLLSDYLLVQLPGTGELTSFRDVFEVDGAAVRDRDRRLQRLFVESPGTAQEQARRIAEESARHNIWDIGTINNPFLSMAFIQDKYRSRFRLQSPKQERSVGPDVYAILYQEYVSPTILKGNGNRDMPVRGRWWIETSTGRVVKTELLLGANSATFGLSAIEIVTTFRYDEDLGLTVPAEMQEFYPSTRTGDVRGTATYGRFRRFGVTTEEQVAQ